MGDYEKPSWEMSDNDGLPDGGSGGSKMGNDDRLWKFRFKMPDASKNKLQRDKPVVHRIMFLNEAPFRFWEHGLYSFRNATDHYTAVCLAKNKIDKRGCPFCDKDGGDNWPSYVGLFTIIDFGQVLYGPGGKVELHHRKWTNKKGEDQEDPFPKLILAAKAGSKKSPGVLQKLLFQAERRGNSLEGTVWDVSRSGDKEAGVGETWEYVDRVDPNEYKEYLAKYGADKESVDVEPIDDWPAFLEGDDSQEYSSKLVSYEEAQKIVGIRPDNEKGRSDGAGYGNDPGQHAGFGDDDDIPF